jgi:hypothetical protein
MLGAKINSATGGTISSITGYVVHTFSSSGIFTPNGSGPIEVLVVGAGGGGGGGLPPAGAFASGSGGGGGAVVYQKFIPVISGVAYTMTVGNGGAGGFYGGPGSGDGGNSTAFFPSGPILCIGGAGGSQAGNPTGNPGVSKVGGSGSGAGGGPTSASLLGGTGPGIVGEGFPGGSSNFKNSGGGGGAGGAGQDSPGSNGANGGAGVSYSISGVSTVYAGGGVGRAPLPSGFASGSLASGCFPNTFGLGDQEV